MKSKFIILVSLFTFGATYFGCINSISNQNNTKNNSKNAAAFELQNMDTLVNPGDNFFNYVNGNWNKKNPIPFDKTKISVFTQLREKNKEDLKNIILEVANNDKAPLGSNIQKVRDFYNSGLDSIKIEQQRLSPIQAILDKINNMKNHTDVQCVAAYLNMYAIYPFFAVSSSIDAKNSKMNLATIWQAGISLPEKDYYFSTDPEIIKIRDAFLVYITNVFILLNENSENALIIAKNILKIETMLAKASFSNIENQDPQKTYNKYNISDLQNISPNINWKAFFTYLGFNHISEINISQVEFIKELNQILKTISVNEWKNFFKWNVINALADYLPSKFAIQHFNFYNKTLYGQEQMDVRWKKVINELDNNIGEILGQLYVEKHFSNDAKQKMNGIVENLRKTMKLSISKLEWMSQKTKNEALAILEKMNVKIGYPDKWRDYSGLEINKDSYLTNILNARYFDFKFYMNMAGKQVDKTLWNMTPQTVNAYQNSSNNEIVFPAGLLQPPIFNIHADDAINYGAIGMMIGHEMTHSFDNTGRQYDKDGNLRDWWTKNDEQEFSKRTEVLVKQFNKFQVIDSVFVNGELTLGENIADLGGLTVAYYAFLNSIANLHQSKLIDGFSNVQRFFLSCAQTWRCNIRDKALKNQVKTDEHSPAISRINVTFFNMPEFYAAFPNIKKGNKLYKNVDERAKIW